MAAEPALLDANVLVARAHPRRRGHREACALLRRTGDLVTTPQVIREFMVVASRPPEANGLGLAPDEAAQTADAYLERLGLLPEDGRVALRLRELIRAHGVAGVSIHDANVVASALAHRVPTIITEDTRDFARYAGLVEVVAPADS